MLMNTTMINRLQSLSAGTRMLCLLALVPLLAGCDKLVASFADADELDFVNELKTQKEEAIQVSNVEFSPDCKTFTVTTRMYEDIGPYSLMDTTRLHISVKETVDGIAKSRRSQPRLVSVRNLKADNIHKAGIHLLALVDATLPQSSLDRIRDYVLELRAVFNHDNLFVAFMDGQTVSESMKATDYVLDNSFKHSDQDFVYLYRFILQKQNEMTCHLDPWSNARRTVLLVFSDGEVYDNETDMPIDPDHYLFEDQLVGGDAAVTPDFQAFFASVRPMREVGESQGSAVLFRYCRATHGLFMQDYSGTQLKNAVLDYFHVSPDANEFVFENPDGKVYRGNDETLNVHFTDVRNDSLVTSFTTTVSKGTIYNPIIVHGRSIPTILINGLLLVTAILIIVWLLMQFIIPFIRYRYFLHKYVIRYTGGNMGVASSLVRESCYYCKQPFEAGDKIVVKCEHAMHKVCWDENEYHCPEYSDRCKHGSHYYNRHNLSDSRNASFVMKWVFMAVVAAWLAWIMFVVSDHALTDFVLTSIDAQNLMPHAPFMPLMSFGFAIGFFLTYGIYMLSTIHYPSLPMRIFGSAVRAIVAAVGCWLVSFLSSFLLAISEISIIDILIEWIPWTLSGFIIAFCGTFHTRVVLRKLLILPSIAFGIITMYVWWLFFDSDIDYRELLLVSFVVYAVGLAVSVASITPRSERFFLKVEGAVKGMDIALYKWFRNNPDSVVTLGKSVDCSLQLSWDIVSDVAPVQAEIRMHQNTLWLIAMEPGVYIQGKAVEPNHRVRLYHGKSFLIGKTTFTYIEKDR